MTDTPPSAQPAQATPSHDAQLDERTLLFITSLGHAICHMGELMFAGVLLAVMAEFDLAPFQAAALGTLGYVLLGVGSLPMGAWADARGPARVLQIYFVLMALAGLAVAVSSSPWQLVLSLTALGLAASIYHPAGLTLLSLGTRNRGRALGINGMFGSVGQALGPLLGAWAASLGMWRLAYVVLAVLALLSGGLMLLARRRVARAGTGRVLVVNCVSSGAETAPGGRPWLPMCLMMGAMLLGGFNYRCLATALPPFFTGETTSAADLFRGGYQVFLVLIVGGCLGQVVGGWAADRFGNRVYPVLVGLLIPSVVLLGWSEGTPAALGIALALAVFLFAQQPVENLLLAEWSDRRRYSRSYGAKCALTFGFGALGTPATGLAWTVFGSPGAIFFFLAGTGTMMILLYTAAVRSLRTEPVDIAPAALALPSPDLSSQPATSPS